MAQNTTAEQSRNRPSAGRRRVLWLGLGALLVIVIAALIAVPLLLNPESYRGHIEQALRETTGWEAELGAIDLSVLRGLELNVAPARLAAAGDGSRVEIERIGVRAELLPLLGGELKITRIDLVRPEIELVRRNLREGWILPHVLDSARQPGTSGPAPDSTASGEPGQHAPGEVTPPDRKASPVTFSIGQIRVRDARLALEDRSVDPPSLIGLEKVRVDLDPGDGLLSGNGELIDGGALSWNGSLDQSVNLELDGVPTDLFAPLIGEGLVHRGGTISGQIEAIPPSRFAGRLSGAGIRLLDGVRPFDAVDAEFDLQGSAGEWVLGMLKIDAGGAKIEGSGALLPDLALGLKLTPTPLETALQAAESVLPLPLDLSPPGSVQAEMRVDRRASDPLTYRGSGELTAARFKPGDMLPDATDVRATFDLERSGVLAIRVLDGRIAGGPLRGTARIEPLVPPGKLSFEGGLTDAVLGQLLGGMVHEAAERVSGPTGLDANMTLDLSRAPIDAKALGGRLDIDSHDVGLPGWDLEGALRSKLEERVSSLGDLAGLLDKQLGERGTEESSSGAPPSDQGLLDRLAADVDFDRYPWALERLVIESGEVSAAGQGTFDPVQGLVDLQVTARLSRRSTDELVRRTKELRVLVGEDGRIALPVDLRGPLLNPSIGVELSDELQQGLEEEIEEKAKGLLEGLLGGKKDDD
jgi:hypothetical protein